MVLCCICGVEIKGVHGGARCAHCLQREVDITEGIDRKAHIQKCRDCERYLRPNTNAWIFCEVESRELLGLCLKTVKGISREHKLVDANFIWTEPHSKELKVKLSLQREAMAGVLMQQQMVVEFRVNDHQCPPCKRSYTQHQWESNVQVRQRSEHHRTLHSLEQLILSHKAHKDVIGIENKKEGLDFFFRKQKDADVFLGFLKSWTILKHEASKQVHNLHFVKRSTVVDLCPVCRHDLVYLPKKVAQGFGGLPPLMLCTGATSSLVLVDPASMRSVEVSSSEYWKKAFLPVSSPARLTEFTVLDIELEQGGDSTSSKSKSKKIRACRVEIARTVDLGINDERITVRSHLGHFLHVSDEVLGYDLRTLNTGIDDIDGKPPLDVYLVKVKRQPKVRTSKRSERAGSEAVAQEVHNIEDVASDEDPEEAELRAADAAQMLGALGSAELLDSAEASGFAEASGSAEAPEAVATEDATQHRAAERVDEGLIAGDARPIDDGAGGQEKLRRQRRAKGKKGKPRGDQDQDENDVI